MKPKNVPYNQKTVYPCKCPNIDVFSYVNFQFIVFEGHKNEQAS